MNNNNQEPPLASEVRPLGQGEEGVVPPAHAVPVDLDGVFDELIATVVPERDQPLSTRVIMAMRESGQEILVNSLTLVACVTAAIMFILDYNNLGTREVDLVRKREYLLTKIGWLEAGKHATSDEMYKTAAADYASRRAGIDEQFETLQDDRERAENALNMFIVLGLGALYILISKFKPKTGNRFPDHPHAHSEPVPRLPPDVDGGAGYLVGGTKPQIHYFVLEFNKKNEIIDVHDLGISTEDKLRSKLKEKKLVLLEIDKKEILNQDFEKEISNSLKASLSDKVRFVDKPAFEEIIERMKKEVMKGGRRRRKRSSRKTKKRTRKQRKGKSRRVKK